MLLLVRWLPQELRGAKWEFFQTLRPDPRGAGMLGPCYVRLQS